MPLLEARTLTLARLGEPKFEWPLASRTQPFGAIVATIPLTAAVQTVIGHGVWFGVRAFGFGRNRTVPKTVNLTKWSIQEVGSGQWEVATWKVSGHGLGWWDDGEEPFWRTYETATMLTFDDSDSVARFAVIVSGIDNAAVSVEDVMVAPIGTEWNAARNHLIKTNDKASVVLLPRRSCVVQVAVSVVAVFLPKLRFKTDYHQTRRLVKTAPPPSGACSGPGTGFPVALYTLRHRSRTMVFCNALLLRPPRSVWCHRATEATR